nr:hypothetical protein [Tanacetum cinerariifolium]
MEVIEFGDSYKAPQEEIGKGPASESSAKKNGRTIVITTEDMQKRRNDVKVRTTLLLALPDEHQLRFNNGKGEVHTASVPTASTQVSTASTDVAAAGISHDTNASIATKWAILLGSAEHLEVKTDVEEETTNKVEARLVKFKTQEIKFCEKIRGLERDVEVRNNKIEYLMNELEEVKKEKEGLNNKLTGFKSASKDLDTLLGIQRTNKNKEGLGYNVVPPPAQVYSPPKKDMSWTGLPEFVDDTVTDYSRPTYNTLCFWVIDVINKFAMYLLYFTRLL